MKSRYKAYFRVQRNPPRKCYSLKISWSVSAGKSKGNTNVVWWIVSGPTSVGKSTFIASPRCPEITGLPPGTPVVFPKAHSRFGELNSTDVLYHYNILRLAKLKRRYERRGLVEKVAEVATGKDFGKDPGWQDLVGHAATKKAVVLVSSKRTILQRARQREVVEAPALAVNSPKRYRQRRWLELLEQVDLIAFYRAWCYELRSCGIPYVLIDASDGTYPVIEDEDRLPALVSGDGPAYTEEEIRSILRERKFEYHRVDLPFGLHTGGSDRSETRDLVLPKSLKGKTVLDVGSALGYFSFEAEARGAKRVVGVELMEKRFRDALLLKDIKGSRVEFVRQDVVSEPLGEHFDHVLLLNVIHHLKEPFRAMRQLASITNERLVIEFPTFADRRFRRSVKFWFPFVYNRLPLVGVSSMTQGVKQTFVFTPSAIKRALLDHERLFDRVDMVRSPIPGRLIAICHKESSFE